MTGKISEQNLNGLFELKFECESLHVQTFLCELLLVLSGLLKKYYVRLIGICLL